MPLDNFITRPDFSRQIKQFSSTTAELGGSTSIAETLKVKNIEINTLNGALNPINGDVLVFDGTSFLPGVASQYGNVILNGMLLSYYTGLTYNVTAGEYRMNGINYQYTGGSVTIASGDSLYNRFDVVFVTGDSSSRTLLLSGTASITPTIPSLFSNQLQVGVISVPANFTGGTGTTIIQTTSATVFEYYLSTNTGIQRASPNNALASGSFSFALSRDSRAYGQDSVALGLGTEASGNSQTVVGQYNILNSDDYFIVGNGTGSTSRSNAFRVTTGGSAYVTNKLFITNVEVETTGASSNHALIYDGTKFKPQLQIITGLTFFTGGTNFISSITSNSLLVKALTGSTGITITESNGLITLGLNFSGSSLGDGVKVLFSSDTTTLSFATLSSQTPSTLRIISSSTGVILFSATTGTGGISGTYVSGITSAGTGNILLLSSITNNNLIHKSISAGTGMQITESNGTLIFVSTATGGTAGSGTTSGTSLGNGVKVLFSSDTTSLSFATLSSQTPSSLRIISSSTGVILFSATTGTGSVGTLDQVTTAGNTTANDISVGNLSATTVNIGSGGIIAKLITTSLTTDKQFNFPDRDGQILVSGYEYIDLSAAQSATALTVSQWYRIPVSSRSVTEASNFNTYGDVILMAVDTNKFSPDGYLLAINADYQVVGDYTDVSNFDTQYGVPYNGEAISTVANLNTNLIIWNNRHWQCNSNGIIVFQDSDITSNFSPLTKDYTTRNGYIIEPQKIVYNLATDTINRMEDKMDNIVINNSNYIENFRFGDNVNVYRNHISTLSPCGIINYPNLFFQSNNMKYGTIINSTTLVSSSVTLNISNCNIQDYSFQNDSTQSLYLVISNIQYNKIYNGVRQFSLTSSTITLPMLSNGQGWVYDQNITSTGGTFNGIVTAITQDNQITNYYQKFRFTNNSGSNIIFRNSTFIKTEGGLDAIITSNSYDSIEFIMGGGIAYQTDINNYV